MPRRKKTDVVTLHLRLREELRAQLAREADRRKVSLNAEIVRRLEEGFQSEEILGTIKTMIQVSMEDVQRTQLRLNEELMRRLEDSVKSGDFRLLDTVSTAVRAKLEEERRKK
jgi:Arc-like DNA binding domain